MPSQRSPRPGSKKERVPDRGDIVWLDFSPQKGREQAQRRPALVLSPAEYNGKVGLMIVCPITGQVKGYPFEVEIPAGLKVSGVVLCDQIKSLDWRARNADRVGALPASLVREVCEKAMALIEPTADDLPGEVEENQS